MSLYTSGKEAGELRLEKHSIDNNLEVDKQALIAINRTGANSAIRLIKSERTKAVQPIKEYVIDKDHIGLLFVNGNFVKTLAHGRHGFWQFDNDIEVKTFDKNTLYFADEKR